MSTSFDFTLAIWYTCTQACRWTCILAHKHTHTLKLSILSTSWPHIRTFLPFFPLFTISPSFPPQLYLLSPQISHLLIQFIPTNSTCINFDFEFTRCGKAFLLYLFPVALNVTSHVVYGHTHSHAAVSINRCLQLTVHARQLWTKTYTCICSWTVHPNKQRKWTRIYTHYHCIAGITPRPGCVQVWALSPCLRSMLISGGGCQLSHICLYLSCSYSLCLRLAASICIYSLQSVFALVRPRFSTSTSLHLSGIPLLLLLFLLKLSSHHSKSCLSFGSYILMHLPPLGETDGV